MKVPVELSPGHLPGLFLVRGKPVRRGNYRNCQPVLWAACTGAPLPLTPRSRRSGPVLLPKRSAGPLGLALALSGHARDPIMRFLIQQEGHHVQRIRRII